MDVGHPWNQVFLSCLVRNNAHSPPQRRTKERNLYCHLQLSKRSKRKLLLQCISSVLVGKHSVVMIVYVLVTNFLGVNLHQIHSRKAKNGKKHHKVDFCNQAKNGHCCNNGYQLSHWEVDWVFKKFVSEMRNDAMNKSMLAVGEQLLQKPFPKNSSTFGERTHTHITLKQNWWLHCFNSCS